MGETRIYKELNILKFIAIFMVFAVHTSQYIEGIISPVKILAMYGQTGCQLFFLVSGFLIANSITNKESFSYSQYLKGKYINIAPAYIIMILFYMLLNLVLVNLFGVTVPFKNNNNVGAIIINMLLLNGLFPFCNNNVMIGGWYIGTTFILYLLSPFIINLLKSRKRLCNLLPYIVAFISLTITVLLKNSLPNLFGNNSFYYFSFINQMPAFLLGIALYYNIQNGKNRNIYLCNLMFLGFTVVSLALFYIRNTEVYSVIPLFTAISFYNLYFLVERIKDNKVLSVLGEKIGGVSFSVYLVHGVFAWYIPSGILSLLKARGLYLNPTLLYLVFLILGFSLATVTALYFNKLITLIKRKLK